VFALQNGEFLFYETFFSKIMLIKIDYKLVMFGQNANQMSEILAKQEVIC